MLIATCPNCGEEFSYYESQKKKFCSSDCWYEYNKKIHEETNKRKCKMCGENFVSKSKDQKFCSRKCSDRHQTLLVGEDNPHFKQVGVVCKQCGIVFYDRTSHAKRRKFCSYACFNNYQQKDEQYKIRMSNVLKKNKEDGKMMSEQTMTKPHRLVVEKLKELGIKYQCEYPLKYYLVDIYLSEYDLMIEINGDYWHSNPILGYDTNGLEQKKRIKRDKSKHTYIQNWFGIEVLYLWEKDILDNIELCMAIINEYINNNGKLENYNSFNYHFNDKNELTINDEIVLAPIDN